MKELIKEFNKTKDINYLHKYYRSEQYQKIYSKPKRKWLRKFEILTKLMNLKTGQKVLDIGCASKMIKPYIETKGAIYKGLDIAEGFEPDYTVDAERLEGIEDDSFDWVIFSDVLEHLPHPQNAIKEAYRVGKKVIAAVPNWYRLERFKLFPRSANDRHVTKKTPKEWIREFENVGFQIKKLQGFYYLPSIAFYPLKPLIAIDLFFRLAPFDKLSAIFDCNCADKPVIRFLGQELILLGEKDS